MSGLPPRRPPQVDRRYSSDTDTVEVLIDTDEDESSHNSHASSLGSLTEEISIGQLTEEVSAAQREVDHLWFLLLRAVWHAVVDRRRALARPARIGSGTGGGGGGGHGPLQTRSAARPSQPLSVEERRAQVEAMRGGRARQDHSRSRLNASSHGDHASLVNTSHHRGTQKPPFLPPARYPVTPALDLDELQRIHHHLYRAVSAVAASGGLSTTAMRTHQLPGHSVASAGTPSVRSAALKRATENLSIAPVPSRPRRTPSLTSGSTQTSRAATERSHGLRAEPATHKGLASSLTLVGTAEASEAPLESVSLLILQVARRRALATLYLRQLRLDVYRRHARQAEVELRHDYYLQRRILAGWRLSARASAQHAKVVLRVCVQAWQEAVAVQQRARAAVHRYAQGIRTRTALYAIYSTHRTRHYWRLWQDAFTYHRVERSLAATASAFQQAHPRAQRRRRVFPFLHEAPISRAAGAGAALVLSDVTPRYALRCLFQVWCDRAGKRALLRTADDAHRRWQQRHAVRRLCAVAADALRASLANPRPRAALTEPLLNRGLSVHVTVPAHAAALWVYKETCASRIAQSQLLQRAFGRWRCRSDDRLAHRFHQTHRRFAVLRAWLAATTRHRQQRATVQVLWQRWRARFAERTVGTRACQMVCESHLQRHVLRQWHARTQARRLDAWRLQTRCLRHWWERAALRAALPILDRTRCTGLFWRWREAAERVRHRRLSLALADTLRETALLLGCVRVWSARCADRRHGLTAAAVLKELRAERQMQRLFAVWRRRTFGSTEPFAL